MYIGISSDILNRQYATQRQGMWCWAASIQTVLRYYGLSISQDTIVRRSFGLDKYGQIPNKPAGFDIMTARLNDWGIDSKGKQYLVQAMLMPGAPSPEVLLREMQAQRPILLSYQSRPTMNHAVVCTAVQVVMQRGIPTLTSIIVRDPWPSQKNMKVHGRIEYPARDFAQKTVAHWIIRVVAR